MSQFCGNLPLQKNPSTQIPGCLLLRQPLSLKNSSVQSPDYSIFRQFSLRPSTNIQIPGCLFLENSKKFRCTITWSSLLLNTNIQIPGCLFLEATSHSKKFKCTITWLSLLLLFWSLSLRPSTNIQIPGCLFLEATSHSKNSSVQSPGCHYSYFFWSLSLRPSTNIQIPGCLFLGQPLTLKNSSVQSPGCHYLLLSLEATSKKFKCTITWLSLLLLFWSFSLRPSTNKLQIYIYRVVYPGGPPLIGKNDFHHFLFSIVRRHLFLNGY